MIDELGGSNKNDELLMFCFDIGFLYNFGKSDSSFNGMIYLLMFKILMIQVSKKAFSPPFIINEL